MDGNNGPKRARSETMEETSSGSTTPAQGAEATPVRDPVLEAQLDQLGLDEEFKASLRCMSPNTRRDVINDIIRNQQHERASVETPFGFLSVLGGSSFLSFPPDLDVHLSLEDEDEEEERGSEAQGSLSPPRRLSPRNGTDDRSGNSRTESEALREQFLRSQLLYLLHAVRSRTVVNTISEVFAQRSLGMTQDIDDMSYEQLLELQERIGYVSKGITKEQMQQCMQDVPWPKEGSCVVCQIEWQDGTGDNERSVELQACHHVFHQRCIEQWLASNKTCPVCKKEVL
ncbi:protein containing C-terminal RING-finger [Trypanosoma rangeli]|uniref:RING-type E3 ubiquitin transferase n=1 Tax=Trypanosoma rangeli TaxID=5698 RepID=A0A3R7MNA0_TRYRA|nr:protein containing C-terminal RING-finger [Trypanosoma rangeli]RNF05610.1 protein containing C-terminal RING-finger [Trypanosoma rangeli]|eukprot:RNF05610.1 protein containing C-terminal RING-finger [Trypanosoma rangeli]